MHWEQVKNQIAGKLHGNSALADQRPLIVVNSRTQRLHWLDIEDDHDRVFEISTAARGMGNFVESFKTPLGIHRIRQKIGGSEPVGTVFSGRVPSGKIARDMNNKNEDQITSRILWLDGLEEGFNHGGNCDTYSRYIYIHGTSDEQRIGQPVSAGCIRMKNSDVIELFDELLVNDLVLIQ